VRRAVERGSTTARRVSWRTSRDAGDPIDLPDYTLRSFGSLAPPMREWLRSLRSFAAIPFSSLFALFVPFRGYSTVGELAFQVREQVHRPETQFGQFSSDSFRMHHAHVGE
jgi:hypothetical protein